MSEKNRSSLSALLVHSPLLVIDGALSTPLERQGIRLNDKLWTARILAQQPELIGQVHLDYLRAGADLLITASYQASMAGLTENGYSEPEAEAIIRRSVSLAQEIRRQWWEQEGKAAGRAWPLILGDVGPYGAYLADGSEYRGHYSVSDEELYEFHRRRMELLWEEGADLLLIETQPSLREALAEAQIAEELGADYWISFSCPDGKHICEGTAIRNCAAVLSQGHPHLKMLGVNCTAPKYIESLIRELKKGTGLPIAVYPNSGEVYDPVSKTWSGEPGSISFDAYARRFYKAGAQAVGGCCTTVDCHIRQVAQVRSSLLR